MTRTGSDGIRHKKSFSSKKKVGGKTIVRDKLDTFIESLKRQQKQEKEGSPFFADVAEKWFEDEKMYLKPASFQRKKSTYENHVAPVFENIPIEEITYEDVQDFIDKMSKNGFSYSSVKKVYEVINSCIRYYRKKRQVYFDPCEGVRIPTVNKKDISDFRFFNEQEIALIEKEASRTYTTGKKVYRLGEAILVLLYTGMRAGELLALEWSDIDYENNIISITKDAILISDPSKTKNKYKTVIQQTPKTKKSRRTIPMSNKAKNALLELSKVTGNDKYIMTTSTGEHVKLFSVDKMFVKILRNAGIISEDESCGVHTLRHTFASVLFKNDVDIKVISEILGHSSTKITEDIYIHLIQQQKAKAIQIFDNIDF